jgi:hypothetical protein
MTKDIYSIQAVPCCTAAGAAVARPYRRCLRSQAIAHTCFFFRVQCASASRWQATAGPLQAAPIQL